MSCSCNPWIEPIPKRRLCIGNPSDLVSSDLLLPFTRLSVSPVATTKIKRNNLVDTRRLSLDSARRSCWDHTPPVTHRRDATLLLSSPRFIPKLVSTGKNQPKNESPKKQLNCESPALRNRNMVKPPSPRSMAKSPNDYIKTLSRAVSLPVGLFKVPLSQRAWSDQRILWSGLPKTFQLRGKEVSSHRQVAVSTAVSALEEASAMESVLLSLQAFSELCDSSKKLSVGQVVCRFLNIYQSTQNTSKVVDMLLTNNQQKSLGRLAANQNAASWVQAAVVTGFSEFNLYKESGKEEDVDDHHHYICIQNTSEKLNPKEATTPKLPAYKGMKLSSAKHRSASDRSSCSLKESASLAAELVRVSSQWFFKYLENSLKKGSFLVKKEEANGKESLLVHLKAVNRWLDDLISNGKETNEKVEDLRKKLQRFLLNHIKSA